MKGRVKGLDLLRILAVVFVLGRHISVCPASTNGFLHEATTIWRQGGWVGVDLFFVLSGFLVSGLLFREHIEHGTVSFKKFFLRRGLKIWPAFWIMIFASAAVRICTRPNLTPAIARHLAIELLFVQNYFDGLWPHTWSLAVEEHFYLLLPLLLILLLKLKQSPNRPFRLIPVLFVCVALTCLARRLTVGSFQGYNHTLFPTHLRIDSLFFGVFISYFFHYYPEKFQYWQNRLRIPFFVLGVILLIPAFAFQLETTYWIYTFGLTVFYLASGMLLIATLSLKLPENRFLDSICFLGSRSYSIYLWHVPAPLWIQTFILPYFLLNNNWYVSCLFVYLIGAILIGVGMAQLIELPLLAWRDRIMPSEPSLLARMDTAAGRQEPGLSDTG